MPKRSLVGPSAIFKILNGKDGCTIAGSGNCEYWRASGCQFIDYDLFANRLHNTAWNPESSYRSIMAKSDRLRWIRQRPLSNMERQSDKYPANFNIFVRNCRQHRTKVYHVWQSLMYAPHSLFAWSRPGLQIFGRTIGQFFWGGRPSDRIDRDRLMSTVRQYFVALPLCHTLSCFRSGSDSLQREEMVRTSPCQSEPSSCRPGSFVLWSFRTITWKRHE